MTDGIAIAVDADEDPELLQKAAQRIREGARTRDWVHPETGELREVFSAPSPREFMEAGSEFLESGHLRDMADELIGRYPDVSWLEQWRLTFLWKRDGGKPGGRVKLGACMKPPALAKHYANTDWVIWIAANHVRDYRLTEDQIYALLFHEMLHCTITGQDKAAIRGHDFEAFTAEVREFGAWKLDLQWAQEVFNNQIPLPIEEAKP